MMFDWVSPQQIILGLVQIGFGFACGWLVWGRR